MPLAPPRRITPHPGRFAWPRHTRLASPRQSDQLPLEQLARDLQAMGISASTSLRAAGPATLRVVRDPTLRNTESYRLRIAPNGLTLSSASDAGAYYGAQTLRDLLEEHGRALPCMDIEDAPDFPRRGLYLDCSRGRVPSHDYLIRLIEQLGHWKINELQLYIENVFAFHRHPAIGRGFNPFTPDDIARLQAECQRHHIRFVPSLASFGHFERILSLPAYRSLGEKPGLWGYPGGTTLCPSDPGSIRLVKELYEEFLPLFDAADFNACCDETWELGRGRSARRAERDGLGVVYLGFIRKLHRLCAGHGKRMNIWSDIVLNHPALLGEVPKDIVMLNWDYHPKGQRLRRSRDIAATGLAWLACPGTNAWQSHGSRLRQAMGNAEDFAREARRHGAEGYLMTDWGDFGHRNLPGASLHGIAFGAAQAWNGRAVEARTFTERFCRHLFGPKSAEPAVRLIETLGRSEEHPQVAGLYHVWSSPIQPGRNLYRGIPPRSPVWMPERHRHDRIGQADPAACAELLEELQAAPRPPPAKDAGCGRLAGDTLEDLALAARMNQLALRRIQAGQALRAGTPPPRKALHRLHQDTEAMIGDFAAAWLRQGRPSRLADNLKLFANMQREFQRVAAP